MGESIAITRTDRSTGGYARYVGRVGGLAFALGVGAAVLTGTAVASADTSDSGATSASSSSSQESGTDAGPTASTSESTRSLEPKQDTDSESESAADGESEADAAETESDDEADEADEALSEADAEVESPSAATEDNSAPRNRESAAPEDDAEPEASTQSMSVAPAAAVEPSPFERFFENQTPTLNHNPSENTVIEGRIEGDLHAEDPDSTRLTYTATRPAHGTVVINPDGTFAYTPGESYAGQDRFDVTVSDARSGFHIHGFAGLLNLLSFGILGNSGHRTTETVFIGFERAVVASGLNSPVDFRFLPDGRVVVAEKGGAIRIVENGTAGAPLITLSVSTLGERGISGLAVDPDFATNGHLYVAYTTSGTVLNTLSRLTVVGNTAGAELVLLQATAGSAVNHHGGALGFGPDGKLYWGVGDNASGANSQNLTNIHGKILRINSDGSTPSDNPSLGAAALPQIYAYGLRNPFRLTFTPAGGLLVADVGAASFEEVNLVTAGGNYGWPGAEGVCTTSCTSIDPIYTYPRGSGAAITSVLVYDGTTFGPDYLNKVFIADLVQGWIKVLTCAPEFTSCSNPQDFDPDAGTTLGLVQGPDGNIYQLTYSGTLVRIAPAGSSLAAAQLV